MPTLPFKTAFACFKGVVVYLSCTVFGFLRVDLTFFAYDYQVTLMAGQAQTGKVSSIRFRFVSSLKFI